MATAKYKHYYMVVDGMLSCHLTWGGTKRVVQRLEIEHTSSLRMACKE